MRAIESKTTIENICSHTSLLQECIREINPYLVLLFCSYAYGTPNEDSDLDILIVTKDDYTPTDFEEHTQLYLKITKAIRPLKRRIAVDLIVHTLPMYRQFVAQNSIFASEILTKGKIIYENDHTVMA